ncbi:hypothetical protein MSG28_005094 [Choristoneura fumiferana]|uniref:Uncharacterized protein n=1 Tax=Choristoneura fumiferana TaxID=7141 RepID=A0ACC0JQG2_CHOFU|nr:hypothetical protein MSG28_005094 [Choristoneura fumiferana]
METNFVRADNTNLPKIDAFMVARFFKNNADNYAAELKNVKTAVSARESYGDDAIGYVQLHRERGICTVKCKMCPEHKVRAKGYNVTLTVDESDCEISSCECHDCAASAGGCKHAVAFLMWVHRRTEEPSCTSIECYWKKSTLSKVGTTMKYITVQQMSKKEVPHRPNQTPEIKNNVDKLIDLMKTSFTVTAISMIEEATRGQNKSSLWYEMRYGRITASKAHEVSVCHTPDGSLVATIMGAKVPDTAAMKRGRNLEHSVRKTPAFEASSCTERGTAAIARKSGNWRTQLTCVGSCVSRPRGIDILLAAPPAAPRRPRSPHHPPTRHAGPLRPPPFPGHNQEKHFSEEFSPALINCSHTSQKFSFKKMEALFLTNTTFVSMD